MVRSTISIRLDIADEHSRVALFVQNTRTGEDGFKLHNMAAAKKI